MYLQNALPAFPLWSTPGFFRRTSSQIPEDAIRLRWLGVAGYSIEYRGTRLLIDPYVSRAPLSALAGAALDPDRAAIMRHVPTADAIVCGHSHYDHVADVPAIALRDDANVIGSESTARIMQAGGVRPERMRTFPQAGGTTSVGQLEVTLVPSRHGKVLFGRVPYPGECADPFPARARAGDYRCGSIYGVLVRAGDVRIYHNGSADLIDEELGRHRAEVVLPGLAGSSRTPAYVERVVSALQPRTLIPTHWDAFFAPLEAPIRVLPVVDMEAFLRDVAVAAPATEVLLPSPLEDVVIDQQGKAWLLGDERH